MSEPYELTVWSEIAGSDDDNVDVFVRLPDGRGFSFTVFTLRNIERLMMTEYEDDLAFVSPGMMIVRRMDEECIRAAVDKTLKYGIIEQIGVENRSEPLS